MDPGCKDAGGFPLSFWGVWGSLRVRASAPASLLEDPVAFSSLHHRPVNEPGACLVAHVVSPLPRHSVHFRYIFVGV